MAAAATAVDDQVGAGDVVAGVRAEIECGLSDVVRRAENAQRDGRKLAVGGTLGFVVLREDGGGMAAI